MQMNPAITPLEVLDIAQQIERNGVAFYQKALELFDKPTPRVVFRTLAEREIEHEHIFARMKEDLIERGLTDFQDTQAEELISPKAMAGLAVFGIGKAPAEMLTGHETIREIIRLAIENERNSIVFYTGLANFVSDKMSRSTIAEVTKEEMRHVRILNESLEQYE